LASYVALNSVVIWDLASEKQWGHLTLPDCEPKAREIGLHRDWRPIRSGVFSSDNRCVALDLLDGTVAVFELASGQVRSAFGKAHPFVSRPGDANFGTAGRGFKHEPPSAPRLAFAPDNNTLAQACRDQIVRVWDVASVAELAAFRGHTGPVTAVAFSPDGRSVASASWDTTALIWDVATLKRTAAPLAPAKNVAAGDYEAHWNALSDRDAAKGFRVISAMMASPKETVHFIEQRL